MRRCGSLLLRALLVPALLASPSTGFAQVAGGLGVRNAPASLKPADRVREALRVAGVRACANVIGQAADFLFEDGTGEFTLQPLGPDANRWPVVLTIESAHAKSGTTRLTILTIAPAGSCSGSYEQIITWPQSCQALKTTVFATFTAQRPLFRNVQRSELTPGIQLYLMPSGTGCVSIKKELIG